MSNTNLPPYLTINLVPDYILKVFLQLPILSVIEETQRHTSQMQTFETPEHAVCGKHKQSMN